jgi:hypothetical protein
MMPLSEFGKQYGREHYGLGSGDNVLPIGAKVVAGATTDRFGVDGAEDEIDTDEPNYNGETAAALLDMIDTYLSRYVIYPDEHSRHAHALWIAHTHLMDCWESTPRIAFLSPEPASGKTRALEVTEPLVPRPIHAINATPAYLFRKVSDPKGLPTILYDEIDTVFGPKAKDNEEIRGVLNAGHRNGAVAGRCVVRGKIVETEELPAYCAVAMAGLNDLPDTIMSRSVVVRMKKRAPTETIKAWRRRLDAPEGQRLGQRLAHWADTVRENAKDYWPDMPAAVEDRDADAWEALLAVADLVGGHWPETARRNAVTLVTASKSGSPSIGVMLLRDLKTIFSNHAEPSTPTGSILTQLKEIEEAPWATFKKDGKPIDDRQLAKRLGGYGIRSCTIRHADGTISKGYYRAAFTDAWERYVVADDDAGTVGDPAMESVTAVTPLQPPLFSAPTQPERNQ